MRLFLLPSGIGLKQENNDCKIAHDKQLYFLDAFLDKQSLMLKFVKQTINSRTNGSKSNALLLFTKIFVNHFVCVLIDELYL